MSATPLDVLAGRAFTFVIGKGGVGKTTTAGALALAFADGGVATHLISTDPAHSLGDLFGETFSGIPVPSRCSAFLTVEEFDAQAYARDWLAAAAEGLARLIERGTYLTAGESSAMLDLSLPGVDEIMAAFRLAELAREAHPRRVVVDTAPTGHTLRLLDAGDVVTTWHDALSAMAAKAAAVATAFAGSGSRVEGVEVLDRIAGDVDAFRALLRDAAFVIVHRAEPLVAAETERLEAVLADRGLRVVARVLTAARPAVPRELATDHVVPWLDDPRGCEGLRAWFRLVKTPVTSFARAGSASPRGHEPASGSGAPAAVAVRRAGGVEPDAVAWLDTVPQRLLLVAGKGGVGKTTCAAAAALRLAESRRVVLFGTDPAGSLGDVLDVTLRGGVATISPSLRVRHIDAPGEFARLRERYENDVRELFARMGLDESLRMDRAVIERLWNVAPPGIDEVVALVEMLEGLDTDEMLVIDAAPTGHFLRLLAMPRTALEWTRALMRALRAVRAADLDGTVRGVIRFSRRIRQFGTMLTDRAAAGAVLIGLDEWLVRAELERLCRELGGAGVAVVAAIVNRAHRAVRRERFGLDACLAPDAPLFRAPFLGEPPSGAAALREFLEQWEMVR